MIVIGMNHLSRSIKDIQVSLSITFQEESTTLRSQIWLPRNIPPNSKYGVLGLSSPPFLVRESHMRTNITLGPRGFGKTLKRFQRSRGGLFNTAWSTIEGPMLVGYWITGNKHAEIWCSRLDSWIELAFSSMYLSICVPYSVCVPFYVSYVLQ